MEYHQQCVAYPAMCRSVQQWVAMASLLLLLTTGVSADVDFSMAWAMKWEDTHYDGAVGSAYGYGIAVDDRASLYISGATQESSGTSYSGFIAKFDSQLNETWYSRDYIPATDQYTGVHRIAVAPDGNLIAHATVVEAGQTYARVMKVSSTDGSVIWQTDIARGNDWANIWDGAAGPVLDSSGNIYIVSGLGADAVVYNGEPLGIYKLNQDGNLLWTAYDYLTDYYPDAEGWDDVWDMVVDSEGSVYITATADMTISAGDLNYGLVKYNAQGQHEWTRCKNWGDYFDAPRGIAIDDQDYIYQSGNVCLPDRNWAAVRKFDKNGNLLAERCMPQDAAYPYGSVTDAQGNLVLHGIYPPDCISEFNLYSADLELLDTFEYQFSGCASYDTPTRGVMDAWGNLYLLQFFDDTEYAGNCSVGVIKIGDNPIPEPTTLVLFALGLVGVGIWRRLATGIGCAAYPLGKTIICEDKMLHC